MSYPYIARGELNASNKRGKRKSKLKQSANSIDARVCVVKLLWRVALFSERNFVVSVRPQYRRVMNACLLCSTKVFRSAQYIIAIWTTAFGEMLDETFDWPMALCIIFLDVKRCCPSYITHIYLNLLPKNRGRGQINVSSQTRPNLSHHHHGVSWGERADRSLSSHNFFKIVDTQ
jgi:hypothetical protein